MVVTREPGVGPQPGWWRSILWCLAAVSALLVVLSAVVPLIMGVGAVDRDSPVRVFFDVSGERNLPAWWNASLLLLAGALSVLIGLLRRPAGVDGRSGWLAWCGLGLLFGLMSLDEFAGIHERLDGVWRLLVGENPLPAFGWLVLGLPLAAVVVVFLWWCARVVPRSSAVLYVLGIAVFFLGALGAELVVVALGIALDSWAYVVSYHVEELLEFLGASVLVAAPVAAVRNARTGDDGASAGLAITWYAGRRRARAAESMR